MKHTFSLVLSVILVTGALLLAGCDRHDHDDHPGMTQVIIESRVVPGQEIARWTADDGWNVDSLPTLTVGDGDDNWGRASWTVRIFEGGQELDLTRVSPGVCGEHSARYHIDDPAVIHFSTAGNVTVGGELRELFHCDHIHVYPREAGTTTMEILLWHVDHFDAATDPIEISVEEPAP